MSVMKNTDEVSTMLISPEHWSRIVASVNDHARELYPQDKGAQEALVQRLLCIRTANGHEALIEEVLQYDFLIPLSSA